MHDPTCGDEWYWLPVVIITISRRQDRLVLRPACTANPVPLTGICRQRMHTLIPARAGGRGNCHTVTVHLEYISCVLSHYIVHSRNYYAPGLVRRKIQEKPTQKFSETSR